MVQRKSHFIAYKVYEFLGNEEIKHNFCWSHCRRYFIESIPLNTKGKELPGSKGAQAREYIDTLFHIEKKIKNLTFEERIEKRQIASRATLDAFWSWCEETSSIPTTKEKLTSVHLQQADVPGYLQTPSKVQSPVQ